ncbi:MULTISPECIES: nicotinate-nucleotide--dimethylbenzimidazole phosphoribosyltransferase [Thermus]|jgi:nicotinate-nucleotide--dimethylbenzimidazole phosphoribosyltransferase|uniref:Nicotinate-nucleotide--dimethylbenzimidazole phosphoribosyltransferase n=1 Tax=Thermus brockianus TaxID=56956 RepID=A0A1J0LW29_THEBO|nr:nicotinate-nucleotide--dimethylbenzimidazole phosphoribosyltransferase [Thermus brockianus]APD10585.1 nicotinate-nucleotide--dimethylbenzimidazole phosphoribosyltransferase [Thermus brockianus]
MQREVLEEAQKRMEDLTKPPRSLGYLEEVAVRLAAIQGRVKPELGRGAVVVAAADHGVVAEGVSAYPQEVTRQMVLNFLRGGAAINQFALAADCEVYVLDVGVMGDLPDHPRLLKAKVREGTRNLALEPALTREEAERALEAGRRAARRALAEGATLLAAGDMGIGNTTAAAALTAGLLGLPPERVVGRGTGVGEEGLRRKREAVGRALARLRPGMDPLGVAAELGGLELIAIAGVYLEGYAQGVPLVLDGFPVTAGALLAWKLEPGIRDHFFAGHLSREPGHRYLLEALGLRPLLDLDLALGEGTGAVLAMPLLRAAARILHMATFAEAGVSRGG